MNKKLALYAILCISVILLVGQSSAIVRTEEEADWTRDSLGSYFRSKYQVFHDKKADQKSLAETTKEYKDYLTSNSRIFGGSVDRVLTGFTDTLSKHKGLAGNNAESFITNLKHQLRQLELKGQLSKDRVQAVLDKAHNQAIRQKILTESEWDKAYSFFTNSYQKPTWYQRVLQLNPSVEDGSSSFNNWLQSVIGHIGHVGGLTHEQTKVIADQLRTSISDTEFNRLGDKAWIDNFTNAISRKTNLKKEQLDKVISSIGRDVNGYKYFALDYTGQAQDQANNWCEQVKTCVDGFWDRVHAYIKHWKSIIKSYFHINHHEPTRVFPQRVTDSIKSVAHSITDDWEASSKSIVQSRSTESVKSRVYDAASQVTNAASQVTSKISDIDLDQVKNFDIKDSFAHFWRSKEHDLYRRLGYTEAQIDWIQDYLTKTFKNQKSSVHSKSDEAAIAIRRYLNAVHVQNPSQIDATVHRLKRHLESWRTLIN
ncbi:hypothetical protein EDC94DRAFT_541233 [Helicostylum pulchrum]|uniref:Uncharacterized protein n=1 Tax=Helicostylum pulchrum TaxID=562976 RepID=A0ABP9Y2R6_9FUNG|nr:hypothetical protein EDC94DRAFT_541233 [Helicostylum pulchrum]